MNALIIEPTAHTPSVNFDPDNNKFEISGKSFPEDAGEFYKPVITWLENYIEQPCEKTDFNFKLDYYNTASAQFIASIMHILETLAIKNVVTVFWHFRQIDEDMKFNGEGFSESVKLNVELVEF